MASIIDVVQGISQAAANAYDGALDENGEPIKVGLMREEGEPLLDKRVMDGFGVRFHGPLLCIHYHSEIQLKEVHGTGFESEIESRINDVASFLKKEYKKITGDSVTLTAEGEVDVLVQSMSRVRSWVQAYKYYKIGGLDEVAKIGEDSENSLEAGYKSFLDQGGFLGKRPDNDTRKK
tara:strand:- start:1898 stop:2431 length:534 start_codon:yes stop_codon:yes gene_type:complete